MKINVRKFADRVGRIFGSKRSKIKSSSVSLKKEKSTVKAKSILPKKAVKTVAAAPKKSNTPNVESKKVKAPAVTSPVNDKVLIEKKVKMKNAILHNSLINQFLTTVAGEGSTKIVGELVEPMQDEEIAKKCKLKVTVVRSVLNKLHAEGITEYAREKDMKTGWFSYMWRLRFDNMVNALKKRKSGEISTISNQLGEESGYIYYTCKKGCLKLPFDAAMEHMFRCPTCNGLLYSANNKRKLKTIVQVHEITKRWKASSLSFCNIIACVYSNVIPAAIIFVKELKVPKTPNSEGEKRRLITGVSA